MSALKAAIEELKALPPHKLAQVSNFLRSLREISLEDRLTAWENTGGSLTAEEADELARNVESC